MPEVNRDRDSADVPSLTGGAADPFSVAVRATRTAMLVTDARSFDHPIIYANDAFYRMPTIAAAAIRGIRIDHSTSWSRDVRGLTGCSGQ